MNLSNALRKRIKDLIKNKNSNGNDLALRAGISRSTINKFLSGQTQTIKIETITLICQATNTTLGEFFSDKIFYDVDVDD